jgi:hypothetical protein
MAAVTHHHNLDGLKHQQSIFSWFWGPAGIAPSFEGEFVLCLYPTF